jgi:ribosomal protein S18 acetylase RimI-like enzyme
MLTYRWMTEQDIPALGALTRRIWNAHYISIITQAQIDYMLEMFYAPDSLAGQLARGHRFLLLEKAQAILGFLSVSHASEASHPLLRGTHEGEENFFLHKFYIAQELQGKGIGKAMLAELLTRMPEIKRLRLQVARKNVNSWNFYLKQGFAIEREADFDVGNGYQMQDYVMEKIIA